MIALVTGGAASGKSACAERLACALGLKRTYLATMAHGGTEAQARIAKHRAQRAGLGFVTLECPSGALTPALEASGGGVILLEDLGNLVSNALFAPDGGMADADEVLSRLETEVMGLADRFDHVVIVGNEVGSEGPSPYESTRIWVRLMGSLACRLAARCDTVAEVVCGRPQVLKGRLP